MITLSPADSRTCSPLTLEKASSSSSAFYEHSCYGIRVSQERKEAILNVLFKVLRVEILLSRVTPLARREHVFKVPTQLLKPLRVLSRWG